MYGQRMVNINIHRFYEKFKKEYNFLYDNHDRVAGYREALNAGDEFIKRNPEFVAEFAKHRGDLIASDREVVAFMFALESEMDDLEKREALQGKRSLL